jgi:hypothetical protein
VATLSTTRNYNDGEVLVEADLDAFLDDIETFLNTTKINDDNIQASGITGSTKLLNQSVTAAKLATDSVETAKIAASAVTTAKIADLNVTTGKLAADAVTSAKIADDQIDSEHYVDGSIDTAHIADDAVTADKLAADASVDANRAVTTDHIRDAAVTTAKINNAAVTPAKQSTYYASGTISTGTWVSNSTTPTAKTMSSITSYARPVRVTLYAGKISLQEDSSGSSITFTVDLQYSSDNASWATVRSAWAEMTSGDGVLTSMSFDGNSASTDTIGALVHIHSSPTAGTAYYRLLGTLDVGSGDTATISTAISFLIEEL